jgi:tetratricopeptide (TPR) repeat protein
MRRVLLVGAGLLLLAAWTPLESPNKAIEEGNTRLRAGKAEEALGHYDRAARELPAEPGVHFDRGAALFGLSRFDEATQEFLRATEARATPLKAAAFYNLGNGFFKQEKYGDAIAAYRRALALDPNDMRAKWNLELALKKKREQDEKKKQDDKKDQKQDSKDQKQDQKKDDQANNEPDKQKEKEKDKQQPQDQQDQKDKKDQKDQQKDDKQASAPPPEPEKGPDQKEMEAILDSLERSPKDLEQERARMRAVRRVPPVKDW